ncbi:MAG: polysaccharide deacetylase family protein [Oscillospiraceae bacterium]|nr:polysaccharide deacetylase family protein [Oscillospiraceae bacterium]
MKKLIVFLSVLLAMLSTVAILLHFEIIGTKTKPVTTPTTEPTQITTTAPPTTEPPTTEPPTTEPPTTTEPEPVIEESGKAVIYEGAALNTYYIDGDETLMALAADLAVESEEEYVPLLETVEEQQYPMWEDEDSGILYITPSAKPFEIPEDVNVPVLMYHAVSDNMWGINELFVSPSDMEKQLEYLLENDYDPIWFQDLSHVEDYDKPVILTFDDGYDDNYTELLPLLEKYNVKATVFVIGSAIGKSHKMTEEQVKAISDSGLVSVQSHGYTHHDMDVMGEEELEYELGETWRIVTRITGKIPSVLCYPTGRYSSTTIEVAKRYYNFGLKMNGGLYNTSVDDPYEVSRYYVSRYTDIYSFGAFVSEAGK